MSVNGTVTSGPNGITAIARNAGIAAMSGARDEDDLVDRLGDDVFLQHQLHAVGEALQQPEGAVHVGADAVLHPSHHATLEPDVEQREDHQDDEGEHDLDDDEPPRVDAEDLEILVVGGEGDAGCVPSGCPSLDRRLLDDRHRLDPDRRTRVRLEVASEVDAVAVAGKPHHTVGDVTQPAPAR